MSTLVYVINGPNLNLLGSREPEVYGTDSLDDIASRLADRADELGLEIEMRQSNHEGHLIDWLHEASAAGAKAVILNAGGYTHTSIALRDAVAAILRAADRLRAHQHIGAARPRDVQLPVEP